MADLIFDIDPATDEPLTLQNWPKWKFTNLWKAQRGIRGFALLGIWWTHQFIGVTFMNFAFEYNRKA